ncbi:hypothetical protein DWX41_22460 [Hungatella hathewayi]|uniref:Uncharacterized protein n=1 Tax=Hungatella hathewayi TaxID=154046 RepID=A0A3E2WC20_9FIRM|nr:hypothetical protein [Faecalicatena contorta]RGC23207.1 hypothetical protein DWX41_22460 [Hungatella hathewayi]
MSAKADASISVFSRFFAPENACHTYFRERGCAVKYPWRYHAPDARRTGLQQNCRIRYPQEHPVIYTLWAVQEQN